MEKLQAKYSDGKTSKLYQAEVSFYLDTIRIELLDDNGLLQYKEWDIKKINIDKHGYSFDYQITYGEFPFEILSVDENFYTEFQAYFPQLKLMDKSTLLIKKRTWKTILLTFTFVAIFTAGMYFFVVPELAEQVAQSIPIEMEIELGESIYQQNMIPFTIDSTQTTLVNDYFKTLNVKGEYDVKITVVDYDEINAFAMPGGHIVIYSGMLKLMRKHEELASVLAHEYAHIHYRHSLRALARSMGNYALLSLVIGDFSGVSGLLIENADNIRSLQYSRELETQADAYAFDLLQSKKMNPEGIIWLFESLKKAQNEQEIKIDIPEFLSSHPETQNRIKSIKAMLRNSKQTYKEQEVQQEIWGRIKNQQ